MSCDSNSNAIARLVCQVSSGITQLDSKQAFYAGLALGAASAGAGALAYGKRKHFGRTYKRLRGGNVTAKTALPSSGSGRAQAIPTKSVVGQSRPRELRPIKPIPKPASRTIPALDRAAQATRLKAATIEMRVGGGETFSSPNSYRVLRPDGSDSGLALTPGVSQSDNGPVEQPGQWGITHTGSGALVSGPYDDFSQAGQLAAQLSGLCWNEVQMPRSDMMKAKNIIKAFDPSGTPDSTQNRSYDRALSEKFDGEECTVKGLQQATGPGSQSSVFGRDDDGQAVYRVSGPRGNIHYTLTGGKTARIVSIFPDQTVENAGVDIGVALQKQLPKIKPAPSDAGD